MTTTTSPPRTTSTACPNTDSDPTAPQGVLSSTTASVGTGAVGGASAAILSALTLVSCLTGTQAQSPQLRDASALASWSTPMRTGRGEIVLGSSDPRVAHRGSVTPIGPPPQAPGQDRLPQATSATIAETRSDQDEVIWLKEHSGLTWEQLGKVFGVSRRSVHLWATGGRMNEANAVQLREFTAVVRAVETDDPTKTRARLLAVTEGASVVDRFRRQHSEALRWGAAFAPEELVGALHDEVREEA